MILYKYVPFEGGRKILRTNTLGFSQPKYFNDPFDIPSYPDERGDNPLDSIVGRLRTMGMNHIWSENAGVLSLTRTPTNPLMWAHYARNHEGLVIGVDVIAAGLTLEESNLIPAQYGSVIYVSRRSDQPFITKPGTGLAVGATHHFPQDHYEKLQRLFLHKSLCWSYEEEVRVVKCLSDISPENGISPSGRFEKLGVGSRPIFLFSLPVGSIKELYFGFRSDNDASEALYHEAKAAHPDISVYECRLNTNALSVGYSRYEPHAGAEAE